MDVNRYSLQNTIPSCFVSFEAARIKHAKVLWASNKLTFDKAVSPQQLHETILEKFAYFEVNTAKELGVSIWSDEKISLNAERYGGSHIGYNGGGGRSGLLDNFQLKGVGKTPLVGEGTDFEHSYGGLDLPWAVIEILYTKLLNQIMPLGAVEVLALIFVEENVAISSLNGKVCPGVILVREGCIRPAHFIRAPFFKPSNEHSQHMSRDVARVKRVNRELFESMRSHDSVVQYFTNFLTEAANQQAFSALARMSHGSITPSNVSIDGRWVDVPMAGFVSAGKNYCRSEPFYEELRAPLNYVLEALATYCKYNNIYLDDSAFIRLYENELNAQLTTHFEYLIEIPYNWFSESTELSSWQILANEALKIIFSDNSVGFFKPEIDELMSEDRIYCWLEAIFLMLTPNCSNILPKIFKKLIFAYDEKHFDFEKINEAVFSLFEFSSELNKEDYFQFSKFRAIKSLKKAYLSKLFYSSAIEHAVIENYKNGGVDSSEVLINECQRLIDWAFEKDKNVCTLFQSDQVKIEYHANESLYLFTFIIGGCQESYSTFELVLERLTAVVGEVIVMYDFNFSEYLNRLNEVIAEFERG